MEYPIDLGNGARGRWMKNRDLLVLHDAPNGGECAVLVTLTGYQARYELVGDDLTIEPPIRCPGCHLLATITAGEWSPI